VRAYCAYERGVIGRREIFRGEMFWGTGYEGVWLGGRLREMYIGLY